MKLTIFGATGGVGRQVVTQALAAGHAVTVVVRDPARLDDADAPGLTVAVIKDLTDPEPLVAPISGADAVISCVGPPGRRDNGIATRATRGILGALATAGVARFVAVSAQPVGPPPAGEGLVGRLVLYPLVRFLLREVRADLTVMEADLRRSAAAWTVVRPPRLVDRPLTGGYRTSVDANVPNGRAAGRADVAHCVLSVLENPVMTGKMVSMAY